MEGRFRLVGSMLKTMYFTLVGCNLVMGPCISHPGSWWERDIEKTETREKMKSCTMEEGEGMKRRRQMVQSMESNQALV